MPEPGFRQAHSRKNPDDPSWVTNLARTVDRLPGFNNQADETVSTYGGWMAMRSMATGFFRVEKLGDRWWIIDPDGYPFIHKGVGYFQPHSGNSPSQKAAMFRKFGSYDNWVKDQTAFLKKIGFNGTGGVSCVDLMRKNDVGMVYTVSLNPMASYKAEYRKKRPEMPDNSDVPGNKGYPFDLVLVFDPGFEEHIEKTMAPIASLAGDRYLLGYYTDNELPWVADALDRHLRDLAHDEPGYIAAKAWLDARKGRDASLADVTDEDRRDFSGYYFETYARKVSAALRKYDPNHLNLGCRFHLGGGAWDNEAIFKAAGKYMDILSINYYKRWEPDPVNMKKWEAWSGRPFIITEFYTKGEDSGLANNSGAGWIVQTQEERGLFYENFTIALLESRNCVGWHWLTYEDNDPADPNAGRSQRDSNKGIVNGNLEPWQPLVEHMSALNHCVYNLIQYLDRPLP